MPQQTSTMQYAKVVFGLPIEGPFDYIIPETLRKNVKAGCRVVVFFGNQKKVGYVIGVTRQSSVKGLKSIIQALDNAPVLNNSMLLTTKKISAYYSCSRGEAIETALPASLRSIKTTALHPSPKVISGTARPESMLVHAGKTDQRWEKFYFIKMREALNLGQKIIILLPEIESLPAAEKLIRDNFKNPLSVLLRNQPEELNRWLEIKAGKVDIVIGTRSAIFAPFDRCGLIIVDEEQSYGYKQDQTPHYHAREAAILRSSVDKATLVLGSSSPSLEAMQLVKKGKIGYFRLPRIKKYPEVRIIDTKRLPLFSNRKNMAFSRYLEDCIMQSLNNKEKILLFLNRLGFATAASCISCGATVKCPRCSINLVFHYKENSLNCHYCNFKMPPPKFCPACNAGYLHYRGTGTEKIESELSRIFPQAKIKELDIRKDKDISAADIFVASQSVIKEAGLNFGLSGVLSIDNTLNHADFRSSEKAFAILNGLLALTDKKMVIQTSLPKNHIFTSLVNDDPGLFYAKELKERKELKFPPFRHFGLLKLRGKNADKVGLAAKALFDKLTKDNNKNVQALSVNPGTPVKLRNNYYWQILLRAKSGPEIGKFLKRSLHGLRHSGIIVTIDIDPI
jgi:primosomal protein N' (replication factor Y) (superfamily II helicase)